MPLQLPNLDDHTYADLVEEALSLIPTHAPDWTNFNPSDPGITLIELFAYLSELLIYRLNQVTDDNIVSFLKLLNGPNMPVVATDPEVLTVAIRMTVQKLRQQERAVTCQDFEELAKKADQRVARALCIANCDPRISFDRLSEGHVGLIVVPKIGKEDELKGSTGILEAVKKDFEEVTTDFGLENRLLLTTRLHVVEPKSLRIEVQAIIIPLADVKDTELKIRVESALRQFFHPLEGSDGKGWPFGRNIFVSELYELLDQIAGVDYVKEDSINVRRVESHLLDRRIAPQGSLIGLELKPYELVELVHTDIKVQAAKRT